MAASRPALQILGLGACTPVGRSVPASAAAARAGVCGFTEHAWMTDSIGTPMRIAQAPWVPLELQGSARLAELLLPAMDEALAGLPPEPRLRLGLALALPPARPGRPERLADELVVDIEALHPRRFMRVERFELGHAAGHLAMASAEAACVRGDLDACLVASVDSYLEDDTLDWIEACDQLHGAGPLNNAWGFVPGEAAGVVLLGAAECARRCGIQALGEVASVGIGQEARPIKSGEVCTGEGLTRALQGALQPLLPGQRVHNVFCDLNGETYRADEYGFAALRTGASFRSASDFAAPADCWGDVGAASAALFTALAVMCHRKHYGHGPWSLTWTSSESGERGAALIRGLDS